MKQNDQAPEKRVLTVGAPIAVNSIFHTIQGEGPFAGVPAVFVRLAGCNLQCPMCDTEYTHRMPMDTAAIVESVGRSVPRIGCGPAAGDWQRAPCDLVVLTGGEPLRQPIGELCHALLKAGYRVQLETNGTLFQPGVPFAHPRFTVVCSPKTGAVHRQLVPWVSAWKYVGTAVSLRPDDGLPGYALDHPASPYLFRPPAGHTAQVYLQPADEQDEARNRANMEAVVESCLVHGHRLCLQLHKIIGKD